MTFSRRYRFLFLLVGFILLVSAASVSAARYQKKFLGQGTDEVTPYYIYDSKKPGPTVMVVGGVHGNEKAGAAAAEQVRSWTVERGKLVVLPKANPKGLQENTRYIPGEIKTQRNLNRNFPKRDDPKAEPRGKLAARIWVLVKKTKPDWVIDLHEALEARAADPKGLGNTVIAHSRGEADRVAQQICEAINKQCPGIKAPFVKLKGDAQTFLASSAHGHLGSHTLIVETHRTKTPLSARVRHHRLAVYELLKHLDMVPKDAVPKATGDSSVQPFACVVRPEEKKGKTVVGLYDAKGTGGRGVPSLTKRFGPRRDVVLVPVGPLDIRDGILANLDVIIFSGGSGSKQAAAIGEEGREAVRAFVKKGGGYIGICAGSYLAMNNFSWSLKILDAKMVSPKWNRGRGTVEVEFTRLGQNLLKPAEKTTKILYHNGPIIEPDGDDSLPDYEVLAHFRTEVAKHGSPKGVMINSPAIVSARCGSGRVLCLSPHAEGSKNEAILDRALRWVTPSR
ncbi:MAG: succinylglutamate desuccinylase/aspartoacylase family protein [Planctomycetia bacterium]|jgi:predicted deacylase/glutamine amidotransferase-like uncharacterized protein